MQPRRPPWIETELPWHWDRAWVTSFHANREPTEAERGHLLAGRRADGSVPGRAALLDGLSATKSRIGYVDLCWSADKSVSWAWAFAPTEAERAIIATAHRDAVDAMMRHVERELGRARKGKAGRDGFEPGRIGWVRFEHHASRPTVEVPRRDAATGEGYTELVTLKVAGDPQLHTHVAVPNVVLTESGRVGGLDLQRLEGRVHEWGALYQAHLATNLRRHGIDIALDDATGAARITAIPDHVRAAFSKRTMNGTEATRRYAAEQGLDWDDLGAERRIGLAKRGEQGDPRQAKQDDLSDWAAWRREAAALGWQHASVLGAEPEPTPTREGGSSRRTRSRSGSWTGICGDGPWPMRRWHGWRRRAGWSRPGSRLLRTSRMWCVPSSAAG